MNPDLLRPPLLTAVPADNFPASLRTLPYATRSCKQIELHIPTRRRRRRGHFIPVKGGRGGVVMGNRSGINPSDRLLAALTVALFHTSSLDEPQISAANRNLRSRVAGRWDGLGNPPFLAS